MPKVTDEYRTAKREEIVDAALAAFRRKGFHATSMADIIAESGLSAGAIYGYHKSKADLIIEVATRIIGSRVVDVERLASADPMPPPANIIRVLMDGMHRDLGAGDIMVQLWGEAMTDSTVKALAGGVIGRLFETYRHYISLWHQREHGLSVEAADALATRQTPLFVSAAQGYLLQNALLPGFDAGAYLDGVEEFLPR